MLCYLPANVVRQQQTFMCRHHEQEMDTDWNHVVALEQRLREGVMSRCEHVQLNGPNNYKQRYPGNVNLSFAYVEGESLLMGLRDIAVSSGAQHWTVFARLLCQ